MEPTDARAKAAQAVSEAVNGLCLFLCGPTFQGLKADAPELLRQWADEYAPVLRKLDLATAKGDSAALRAAVAKISALADAAFDPGVPGQLVTLRAAIREALTAMRIPLPVLTAKGAAVCELHGPQCPALKRGK